jgi:hypothetical protein
MLLIPEQVTIITAITYFYRMETSVVDLAYVMCLFCFHPEALYEMKHKPMIIAGTVVPLSVSPLMLHLWVVAGTANANFLFFPGLCCWMYYAVAVVEFTKATLALKVDTGDTAMHECSNDDARLRPARAGAKPKATNDNM